MSQLTFFSPSKVNLLLNVEKKRTDGYHELQNIMQGLDFGDQISIEFNHANNDWVLSSNEPIMPTDESNLIVKALKLFFQKSQMKMLGLKIHVHKKIPIGAGLAGGSSNAVSTLKAMNDHFGKKLSNHDLDSIAKDLGSDTNFFLEPSTWLLKGRGEIRVKEIPSKIWYYLLIIPAFGCETKKVYSKYIFNLTNFAEDHSLLESLLLTGTSVQVSEMVKNSLEKAVFECYPELDKIKQEIEVKTGDKVLLSGSGSTLFIMKDTEKQRDFVEETLKSSMNDIKFIKAQTLICNKKK